MTMTTDQVIQIVTQLGLPTVIVVALGWWLTQRAIPGVLDTFKDIVADFRKELATEREYHAKSVERALSAMSKEHERIIEEIKESRT